MVFAMGLILAGPAQAQSVYLEEMTWPEVRARIGQGYSSVILPTGGTEQSGPHLALGKHNFVVKAAAGRIAARLGQTLVAPVVAVVPEGSLAAKAGNLAFPGTLGLSDETFAQVLKDMAESLAQSGFQRIFLLGDHGQSQAVQARVAAQLTAAWQARGVAVIHVRAYYDPEGDDRALLAMGYAPGDLGDHGGLADTAVLMAVEARAYRPKQAALSKWPKDGPSGATGRPDLASAKVGEQLLKRRVDKAVAQMRAASVRLE